MQIATGILGEVTSSRFTSHSTNVARVKNFPDIILRSNQGSVLIHGDGWKFNPNTIYPYDIRSIDPSLPSAIPTISVIGTHGEQAYTLKFTKQTIDRHKCLSLISVNPISNNSITNRLALFFKQFLQWI